MKICENFSGNSLKEDLSIDTTFDPSYFSWDSPFKLFERNLWQSSAVASILPVGIHTPFLIEALHLIN